MDISALVTPIRRRRRPAVSCTPCRRRKIRCNREYPCSSCEKATNTTCSYDGYYRESPAQKPGFNTFRYETGQGRAAEAAANNGAQHLFPGAGLIDSALSRIVPQLPGAERSSPGTDVESLKKKMEILEDLVIASSRSSGSGDASLSSAAPSHSPTIVATTGMGDMILDSVEERRGVTRSLAYKRRLFGQSHWMHATTMFPDTFMMTQTCIKNPDVSAWLRHSKSLSNTIKAARTPPWPSPPTRHLPERPVADELVHIYLTTFETVYRILHVPTFQHSYGAVRAVGGAEAADECFIVQLKLVLALGSVMYDDTFSMRKSAIRWICEAQTWTAKPVTKTRLDIQSLQTSLLLILAREVVGVGGDSTWISVGAVYRTAIHMGLHRDAAHLPKTSMFAAEMRRRLWNTILELMLQSSMALGAPPLLSLSDFDTAPPGNYDDVDISPTEGNDSNPFLSPDHISTQMSTAIALRGTLPARLAVARHLNQLGSQTSYPETLRIDKELKAAYKDLCRTLKGLVPPMSTSACGFAWHLVDYIMHRYMISLHVPFFGLGLSDGAFAYSRKSAVDLALDIWPAAYPLTTIADGRFQSRGQTGGGILASAAQGHLARLITGGVGIFRSTAHIAALVATAELMATVQQDPGLLGQASPPPCWAVLAVAEEYAVWTLLCIQAGELNVKAALLQGMLMAHLQWLTRRGGEDTLTNVMSEAAEGVRQRCLPILEAAAAAEEGTTAHDEITNQEFEPVVTLEDAQGWIMTSDMSFGFGDMEFLGWDLGSEGTN